MKDSHEINKRTTARNYTFMEKMKPLTSDENEQLAIAEKEFNTAKERLNALADLSRRKEHFSNASRIQAMLSEANNRVNLKSRRA